MYAGYEPPVLGFFCREKPPDRRGLGRIPHHQSSPGEQPPKEVHVRLHPEEGLVDGDEASDMQHPRRIEVLQL